MSFADVRRGVDVTATAEVLEAHSHDPALADRWAKAGRRAGVVEFYCRVGVSHPDAAASAENLGLVVGELAHHQTRTWGDVERLDEALGWYDSLEAPRASMTLPTSRPHERAWRRCAPATPTRPTPPTSTCRCRGRVEHNWLARHRRPRVRVAVVLIETNDGVVEVWSDDDCYSADPDALRGDAERHAGPCRLRHDVRLDDHDALSVLEDFLEDHVDVGRASCTGRRQASTSPAATAT